MDLLTDNQMQGDLLRRLGSTKPSLQHLKLKSLDKLLCDVDDNMKLYAYILWLHKGFLSETAASSHQTTSTARASLLQSWCQRLQNFGFHRQRVFDALCDWNTAQFQWNRDNTHRNYTENIEEELETIWSRTSGRIVGKRKRDLGQPQPTSSNVSPTQHMDSLARKTYETHDDMEYRSATPNRNRHDQDSIIKKPEVVVISSWTDNCGVKVEAHDDSNKKLEKKEVAKQQPFKTIESSEHSATMSASVHDGSMATYESPPPFTQYDPAMSRPKSGYFCYRCDVPGPYIVDWPTFLNPVFDEPAKGNYQCSVCGKMKEHLSSLCPSNTNPLSMTQLRLKHGFDTTIFVQNWDRNSHGYCKTEAGDPKQQRQAHGIPSGASMHESRHRAIQGLGDSRVNDEDSYESRYTQGKRNCARQRPPDSEPSYGHKRNTTSPPPKRSRRDGRELGQSRSRTLSQESEWESRRDQEDIVGFMSPDRIWERGDSCGSTMSFLNHREAEQGRLSYRDSEYLNPQTFRKTEVFGPQETSFYSLSSHLEQLPMVYHSQSVKSKKQEIRQRFPHTDPVWVHAMATLNVDTFLDKLVVTKFCGSVHVKAAVSSMNTIPKQSDEHDNSPQRSFRADNCSFEVDDGSSNRVDFASVVEMDQTNRPQQAEFQFS